MVVESAQTAYLMTLKGSISFDAAARINHRLIFEVSNASFEGPHIRGEVVPPAGDWIQVMPNGTWKLDVRMNAVLDDGSQAYLHYNGIVCMTEELMGRAAAGECLTGDDIYFRSAPYIETNSEKYSWLNDIVCVGKLRTFENGEVVYDIFKLL
ncbi:hypothetical protein R50073_42430 [Maricurvus nonylphenolicus]|uniref:DUF3237 domain-containing protein n=1 Tax=Maricurvus nonylphenolicus TaxID=1008307 RepID=UPI0036F37AA1